MSEAPWKQDGATVRTADGYWLATCATETIARTIVDMHGQYEALMGAAKALEQCVDDMGPMRSICQQAKDEAIEALAALRSAGIEIGEGE